MPRVAVEDSLTQVRDVLRDNGYDVVELGNWQNQVDAVVISGIDVNVLSDLGEEAKGAPIINASGRSASEVFSEVHERLSPTKHR